MSTLCIFEDDAYSQFYPLTYTRPVYELVCGMTSLREKILRVYGDCDIAFQCRPQVARILQKEQPGLSINTLPRGDCLFINGRLLPQADLSDGIPLEGEETHYVLGGVLVAARLRWERAGDIDLDEPITRDALETDRQIEIDGELIHYPWELIAKNGEWLRRDYETLNRSFSPEGTQYENVTCVNEEHITIEKKARVKPGVVLDAESGPIYIGEEATIHPNAVIEGPASIGARTRIKAGARISGGTTIGPVCKIGGEVEGSIILGYSNKQHDGFLGHSYIGSWVNLGAGTSNSDLKNNYHPVRVYIDDKVIDTGSLFVGLIMGDHSKTGINTMFNTGTIAGVSCNVFGAGFPPKFIPSFSWCSSGEMEEYDIDRALETARRVMARRDKELSAAEEALLRHVYETTGGERTRVRKV